MNIKLNFVSLAYSSKQAMFETLLIYIFLNYLQRVHHIIHT